MFPNFNFYLTECATYYIYFTNFRHSTDLAAWTIAKRFSDINQPLETSQELTKLRLKKTRLSVVHLEEYHLIIRKHFANGFHGKSTGTTTHNKFKRLNQKEFNIEIHHYLWTATPLASSYNNRLSQPTNIGSSIPYANLTLFLVECLIKFSDFFPGLSSKK